MNTAENILKLVPISDLLNMKFFVPSYQRGYRWSERQVTELLDDIWEFRQSSQERSTQEFYCLQPVVVAEREGEWILIDGQQRLTTIHLILSCLEKQMVALEKEKYAIRYSTRPQSEAFLKAIALEKAEENIDYFYLCQAYKTIEKWFGEKGGTTKIHFLTTLLSEDEVGRNVKVIWYEIRDTTSHVEVFTRINIGKIPLTNAELVKALMLGHVKEVYGKEKIELKQLQIASEWDQIEYQLQDDSFWHFIYGGNNPYETRIEYIFDLLMDKETDDESDFTFHRFHEQLSNGATIDGIWLKVKRCFQQFEEWYHDRELYHLIGYLIAIGTNLKAIRNSCAGKTKSEFREALTLRIAQDCNYEISALRYKNPRIKSLLLLFNIQTIISNIHCYIRFPFDQYKLENWDIEHIRSVKSDPPTGNKRKDWLKGVVEYFEGIKRDQAKVQSPPDPNNAETKLVSAVKAALNVHKLNDSEFQAIYDQVLLHFRENTEPNDIDSVSNLTLLDYRTNRGYKNAVFPVKRKTILENDMKGTFVPICTKNVFVKAYSSKFEGALFWTPNDAADYLGAIENMLAPYFTLNESSQNG